MKHTLCLSLLLCGVAAAVNWTEHKNLEPDPARPLGWRFEVPNDWKQSSLARFPYPLGESWDGADGNLQVCWLGNSITVGKEQLTLEERGYARSDRRVAGRDAEVFEKNNDLFCYVRTPQGECRLHVQGSNPVSQHILQSFTLMEAAPAPATTDPVRLGSWLLTPPPGWSFQAPDMFKAGEQPVVRVSVEDLPKDSMVRGWARNEGSQSNPKLKERLGMEPFSNSRGVDGYLVEWKGPAGSQLYAYTALHGKGLKFELLRPSELEHLRRLLSALQVQP